MYVVCVVSGRAYKLADWKGWERERERDMPVMPLMPTKTCMTTNGHFQEQNYFKTSFEIWILVCIPSDNRGVLNYLQKFPNISKHFQFLICSITFGISKTIPRPSKIIHFNLCFRNPDSTVYLHFVFVKNKKQFLPFQISLSYTEDLLLQKNLYFSPDALPLRNVWFKTDVQNVQQKRSFICN